MIGDRKIRQAYFDWLYDQAFLVRDVDSPRPYTFLCEVMHGIAFGEGVPNDSNRAAEGEELRDEFVSQYDDIGVAEYAEMSSLGRASIFEVLVGLSRKAQFISDDWTADEWFRKFTENLGLMHYADSRWDRQDHINTARILRRWNERKYRPDGYGGIFPLRHPMNDQRRIELWYQMAAYMTENTMG